MTKTELVNQPKPIRKTTKSDNEQEKNTKKLTTKMMIVAALKVLKTRKGTSLYAIKKYLEEEFHVIPEKSKYLIKKSIKSGLEDGTIVQVKGVGASGSFKLGKEEKVKKPKKKPPKIIEGELKQKTKKKTIEKPVKIERAKPERKEISQEKKTVKKVKISEKSEPSEKKTIKKKANNQIRDDSKPEKKKTVKSVKTPAKSKTSMAKRKSIGSIIKPPKMKPKKN